MAHHVRLWRAPRLPRRLSISLINTVPAITAHDEMVYVVQAKSYMVQGFVPSRPPTVAFSFDPLYAELPASIMALGFFSVTIRWWLPTSLCHDGHHTPFSARMAQLWHLARSKSCGRRGVLAILTRSCGNSVARL